MIDEGRETLADIAQIKSGALSTLSLALSPAANARIGVALLKQFCERNPLTRLKVVVDPSREIVLGVGQGRLGIGLWSLPSQHARSLRPASLLCRNETLDVCRDHPARRKLARHSSRTLRELPLVTSYPDEGARCSSAERLRDAFASVWEVSHMELRLALVADGKGVTHVSDLLSSVPAQAVPVEGLPYSSIDRQVGAFCLKHQPVSQAGTRFLALCHERWPRRC